MSTYSPGCKVTIGNDVIIDLTGDTVAANKMLSGITAHDKDGAAIVGSIQSQGAVTITPSRSSQTGIAAGMYALGAVTVAAIPATYYTITEAAAELYPVGSLFATEDDDDNPATILGIGTWSLISPANTVNQLKSVTEGFVTVGEIYLWRRTA